MFVPTQQLIENRAGGCPSDQPDLLQPLMMTTRSVRIVSVLDGGRAVHEIKYDANVYSLKEVEKPTRCAMNLRQSIASRPAPCL